ncbi:MAG: phosphoglycerate kinase [Alphaproteobacteria bacterium]|nr:phosphoglycerate kinase [Alphaproteobacteria bacterium]MBU1514074.1 phosphoglycerate kinase [Alphaproteobacteria bacterium]MBU2096277.1 phosphoglycerate kinase [Alphaproteobacteria bacterium]MBU2152725.1 phosphoglycerate kinase [Alphaproteobacteria bacterium]MBU2308971.1 phosphoglycerate kinase [Alphaproteobacteria bacterium]
MAFRTLDDAELQGRRALVRVDLNVPMEDGQVTDDTRLQAAKPTVDKLRAGGAKVILLAHFDRPKGKVVPSMSLQPIVEPLAKVLGVPVAFAEDCIGQKAREAVNAMQPGDVLLLENVRFHAGEEANDLKFADALAANGDLFVNDAFSAAHRAHASTVGLARRLPAYAGEQMRLELDALDAALGRPQRPVLGIVGGSKVSTKLDLLRNLVTKLDKLAIGGGMANTFLYAQGHDVGASYCEKDLAETARDIIRLAGQNNCKLFLPLDIVVAEKLAPGAPARVRDVGSIDEHERILDAGPETVERLCRAMDNSKTLIWNGPLGVFEMPPFDKGTMKAAHHAAELAKAGKLVAVAGGGDTVAALNAAGVSQDFTFVSTAGGAFLEWMEGKELPGVAALSQ